MSDITEGKFDEVEGGHRTSTPNTSKYKRSSSVTSPELKNIKRQIDSLEKMYFEILKIIDTDKRSLYSESSHSSTSISSFTPSLSEYKSGNNNNNNVDNYHVNTQSNSHKPIVKSMSQRSSSFANRNQMRNSSTHKDNSELK